VRRAPHAERRTPSAARRTPSAERRAPSAAPSACACDRAPVDAHLSTPTGRATPSRPASGRAALASPISAP
jgi:hypothetical protein